MAAAILAIEVEDYDKWRPRFDGMAEVRREHRIRDGHVYRDVANPNMITVVIEGDLSDLQAYSQSQALKEAMAEAGVVGPPDLSFVNEVT